MSKSVSFWQVFGFLFTSVMGTFLHFLYDLSSQSVIAGLFSAVNESIWEHMKLVFFPMAVFALIQYYFWEKRRPGFWCVKLAGIVLALVLIPVLYYTYTGVLGVSADWVNIGIFFIAAGAAYLLEYWLFTQAFSCRLSSIGAIAVICLLALVFIVFTFMPPQVPLYEDPVTGSYGIQKTM